MSPHGPAPTVISEKSLLILIGLANFRSMFALRSVSIPMREVSGSPLKEPPLRPMDWRGSVAVSLDTAHRAEGLSRDVV